MRAKKRAAPVDQTGSGKQEKAALAGTTISESYPNTCDSMISSILKKSGIHMTAKEIAYSIGVSDPRVITRQIQIERTSAAPICASTGGDNPGYFWPESLSELESYIRSLRRRHKAISATLDGLERALDSMTGQTHIDLDGGEDSE